MEQVRDAPPAVACTRCRKQKLRCSRGLPACQRCHRAGTRCSYPQPPDRKRLALERAAPTSSAAVVVQHSVSPLSQDNPAPAHESRWPYRAEPTPPAVVSLDESAPVEQPPVSLSTEVALYLFEIYFERHYQADLLFRKRQFIADYQTDKACPYVVLAVLAFASLFLPSRPDGVTHGKIDILHLSIANWNVIVQQLADRASEQALSKADKPSLSLVQACQVLAMVWFAKGETTRTNMHTAIAYRASRLLHLDHVSHVDWSANKELEVRCFWACWLTKCASQENSRFQGDCWAEVVGRLLPRDDDYDKVVADSSINCLDGKGDLVPSPGRGQNFSFGSMLILVQGLWWEVQTFARSIHQRLRTPSELASQYYYLDKKIEEHPVQAVVARQQMASCDNGATPLEESGREFSLRYLFKLCALYLHSSVVPVFSCLEQTRILSQPMLRLAAERAWEQSLMLAAMTERYLSRQSAISKLWPVVGYGAYVCAAVQLRRCLALQLLTEQWIERVGIHLRVTEELMEYWATLKPLHEDMERQFAQAQQLCVKPQQALSRATRGPTERTSGKNIDNNVESPLERCDTAISSGLGSKIHTYVANEDGVQTSPSWHTSTPQNDAGLQSSIPDVLPRPTATAPTTVVTTNTGLHSRADNMTEPTSAASTYASMAQHGGDGSWVTQSASESASLSSISTAVWWDQDLGAFGEVFGSGFFWPQDSGDFMDFT